MHDEPANPGYGPLTVYNQSNYGDSKYSAPQAITREMPITRNAPWEKVQSPHNMNITLEHRSVFVICNNQCCIQMLTITH